MNASTVCQNRDRTLVAPTKTVYSTLSTTIKRSFAAAAPLSKSFSNSINCYLAIVSFVVRLFVTGCPFAIARFVVTVVVDPFNRRAMRRALPHVVIKVSKRLNPSVADNDTSRAVIFIKFVVAVIAPVSHLRPRMPFWRMRHTVRSETFYRQLFFQASARLCMAVFQVVNADGHRRAAFANTCCKSPIPRLALFWTRSMSSSCSNFLTHNSESTKDQSDDILFNSHDVSLQNRLVRKPFADQCVRLSSFYSMGA